MLRYCDSPYGAPRRRTREVMVGGIGIGGANPIRVQSMLTSDTRDTDACVREALELADAGCEIVRVTAQTKKIAENLEHIVAGIRAAGRDTPVVADIHFKPNAAFEAAKWVEKVRVNPGNFADSKKFQVREYSDAEYAEELERLREQFAPLAVQCRDHGVAMRIGTNHGSLSDRVLNRYGDTPLGMVESALEFARIAREERYHNFVFSMKASNPKVMVEAYRLLVARLQDEGEDWNYPLHLGVTEAGDGEDGRIKSAIGIGSLLLDGIGDTIRVSLTEDAIHEIPVARALLEVCETARVQGEDGFTAEGGWAASERPFDPFEFRRRGSQRVELKGREIAVGADDFVRVVTPRKRWESLQSRLDALGDCRPEGVFEDLELAEVDPRNDDQMAKLSKQEQPVLVTVADGLDLPVVPAYRLLAARLPERHPILLKDGFDSAEWVKDENPEALGLSVMLQAGAELGSLLCDGIGDALLLRREGDAEKSVRLAFNVLQAAGTRIFKTDYVACPSCGRTLFNLQDTTQKIRAATGHLKGVRIAVMGCIVNGPGEMADADFGYVGGAPGKINLYVGKEPVEFSIPEAEAVDRLIDLIREHGRWVDPAESSESTDGDEASVPRPSDPAVAVSGE